MIFRWAKPYRMFISKTINWPASVISWSSVGVWAPRRRRPGCVDRSLAPMKPSRALQETSHIVFVTSPRNLLRGEGIIDNVDVSLVSSGTRELGDIVGRDQSRGLRSILVLHVSRGRRRFTVKFILLPYRILQTQCNFRSISFSK